MIYNHHRNNGNNYFYYIYFEKEQMCDWNNMELFHLHFLG